MADRDLYMIEDGGTLRILDSGLEIVRRQKHEWIGSLDKLPHDKLVRRTGKIWGSKFSPEWTLSVLAEWISDVVIEEEWELRPGESRQVERSLDRVVGLAAGVETHTIRVVSDGRYVHAYPINE